MKLLLTVEDIAKYRPASEGIPVERINPYIQEAQEIDLCTVIGQVLYTDFLAKFDQTGDPKYTAYQELLNGKSYTPAGSPGAIDYPGLVPMLSYFALARMYVNNPINFTRYGLTRKLNDQSESIDTAGINAAIAELRSIGISYQNKVVKLLQDNVTDYPLYSYNGSGTINVSGAKFFDV